MTKGLNMEYFTKNDETMVRNAVAATFPGYCVSFMEDPDDPSVVFVRLYDVAVSDIEPFKQKLRKVLREDVRVSDADLIPSIVSHENTRKYYAEYLRKEVPIDDSTLKILVGMERRPRYSFVEPDIIREWSEESFASSDMGDVHVREYSRFAA